MRMKRFIVQIMNKGTTTIEFVCANISTISMNIFKNTGNILRYQNIIRGRHGVKTAYGKHTFFAQRNIFIENTTTYLLEDIKLPYLFVVLPTGITSFSLSKYDKLREDVFNSASSKYVVVFSINIFLCAKKVCLPYAVSHIHESEVPINSFFNGQI
jgi:hypothetical protein